jgi:phosphoinositide-3-kinase regulatory subunit 4
MIQKDPNDRLSANDYLTSEKGKSFPEYFYSFMLSYMQSFSADPTMTPDRKMDR